MPGFSKLSSFLDLTALANVTNHMAGWASPEMLETLKAIGDAAREVEQWARVVNPAVENIRAAGFPPFRGGMTVAPFDILGDTLRGMRGLATDMFRRPDKVLAACERLVPLAIDWATKAPAPHVGSAHLHPASQRRGWLHERGAFQDDLLAYAP